MHGLKNWIGSVGLTSWIKNCTMVLKIELGQNWICLRFSILSIFDRFLVFFLDRTSGWFLVQSIKLAGLVFKTINRI